VAETLVVGCAFNNLLPARLGELFRADYAKRRFGVTGLPRWGRSRWSACSTFSSWWLFGGSLFALSFLELVSLAGALIVAMKLIGAVQRLQRQELA
jgi:hypothetical protein